jgi:translation initiation factor 4A
MDSEIAVENIKNDEIKNWEDLNIKDNLLRGIFAYGFEAPSEIQKKAIQPIIQKHDIIAQAQSGSGKTGTFSIGTLERINIDEKTTQAIILAPTHELAKQITAVISGIGSFFTGLTVKTLIGGTSIQEDANNIRETPPHIIVGCAGRVYDMIKRRYVNTNNLKLLILDEADEMLSKGFKDQIYNIFQFLNEDIQVALFSATMPNEILSLTKKFMRDPVKIIVKKEELNLACIQQYFVAVYNDHAKYDMLKQLFAVISLNQCIIYCNSVKRVIDLYKAMIEEGFSVCSIHSNMDKTERDNMFKSFRSGNYRVLISSNITARGIDVQQVSTVINFDIPKCVNTYLHRIGRSGRWGRKGLAINFVTKRDVYDMKKIENHYKINILELPEKFSP